MYVGWKMKTELKTVTADTPVTKAREIMDEFNIAHLPVVDADKRLLGIITDRDLKEAWASPASTLSVHELFYLLRNLKVETVMRKDVISVSPDTTIERAALVIHDQKIGALPVVEDGKLVGIITHTDLIELLLRALGMSDDSVRISLFVKDRIGILAEIGQLMQQAALNIRSVLTVPVDGEDGAWQVMLRVNATVRDRAMEVLTDAGFKPFSEYVKDIQPYLPE